MNTNQLLNIAISVAPYVFGAGGILAYFTERNKRKIELATKEAGALQNMQKAYDEFVIHTKEVVNRLEKELTEVSKELKDVKKQFSDYKKEHATC